MTDTADLPTRISIAIRSYRLNCRDSVTAHFSVHPATFAELANLHVDSPFRVSITADGTAILCGFVVDRDPRTEIGDVRLLAEFRG